ncbi:MAG TPA: ABC transporter permease [Candidatus Krumholzibacterium sp.]|nr:ABC transporter permease [Candidatus Krumholzibacterium sp.]
MKHGGGTGSMDGVSTRIRPSIGGRFGRKAVHGGPERRLFMASALLVALLAVVSVFAPFFTPYGMNEIDLDNINAGPGPGHVLGTDELGRDLFARLLFGGRFSLMIAFASVSIAVVTGIVLGGAAGYFGGAVDRMITGLIDVFLSIPVFLVLLVAASAAGGSILMIPVIIGATTWMETARTVRARFMQLGNEEYVQAARSIGAGDRSIFLRHILPQALMPVTVAATSGFAGAMLIESSLSFLGFGIQPPLPSWGNMLHNAQSLIRVSPLAAFAPGFLIFMSCLAFNFIAARLKRVLARDVRG